MGYLSRRFIKDKGKRYTFYIIMDIILIIVLLLFAFAELGTFQAGYDVGFQNGQVSCIMPLNDSPTTIEDIQKGLEAKLDMDFNKTTFSPAIDENSGFTNCHTFLYKLG